MTKNSLLIIFIFTTLIFAQKLPVEQIAWQISEENYDVAEKLIDSLHSGLEKDFWNGANHAARWNDLRLEEDYKKSMDLFSKFTKIPLDSISEMEKYYTAQAIGELSIRKAQEGEWLGAATESWKSVGLLEDVLSNKPEFVDAQTGIAVFRYWVADRLPLYYWLSFHFSTKNNATDLLEEISFNGVLNKDLAMQQLFWIYINENDFEHVQRVRIRYGQRHPKSRMKMWMDYFYHAHNGDDSLAYKNLEKLEMVYQNLDQRSNINLTEILVNKFKYALLLGKKKDALFIRKKLDKFRYSPFERKFLDHKLSLFIKLKSEFVKTFGSSSKN